jgi:hypothetical protein
MGEVPVTALCSADGDEGVPKRARSGEQLVSVVSGEAEVQPRLLAVRWQFTFTVQTMDKVEDVMLYSPSEKGCGG